MSCPIPSGRLVGIQRGSGYRTALEAMLDQFHAVGDKGRCEHIKMLGAGRIDAAIVRAAYRLCRSMPLLADMARDGTTLHFIAACETGAAL